MVFHRETLKILSMTPHVLLQTSSALEALSTFIRASRGPKREHEVWVAYRLSNLPKNSKKIGKSPERAFLSPIWSKMTPQIGQNEHFFDTKSQFSGSFIDL